MKKQKTAIEKLTDKLNVELEKMHETQQSIKREGNQIVVPSFMTPMEAAKAIVTWEKMMEEDTQKVIRVRGHKDDLLAAFERAMVGTFGLLCGGASEVMGFFGPMKVPGRSITVQVDYNEEVTVPYGKVAIPGLPIEMEIAVNEHETLPMESELFVKCDYKKKYEPMIDMIEKAVKRELKENPIFKGKAIDSRFKFLHLNGFPLERIAYAEREAEELNVHVFRMIKSTKEARKKGLSLKRTILLHGRYGTGKTLTALKAATLCVENGWTFMNVVPGDDIATALNFAVKYQPCAVFFEDIDQITDGGRDSKINVILNTVDGLLSKSAQVMTILTTNHVGNIEKAMLRPGRIDAVIEMGVVDKVSLRGLVEGYCGPMLVEEVDAGRLMAVAEGYTPSFVSEACNRAILYSLERGDGKGITNDDLHGSLAGLRSQFELMNAERNVAKPRMESIIGDIVSEVVDGRVDRKVRYLAEAFGGDYPKRYDKAKADAERAAN